MYCINTVITVGVNEGNLHIDNTNEKHLKETEIIEVSGVHLRGWQFIFVM